MPKVSKMLSLLLVLLVACASGVIEPVPIETGDMCSFCKMAISQRQFAAEIIFSDEKILKFDDIGCLLRHRREAVDQRQAAAIFVTDHDSRRWLRAEDAFFAKTETKTPMGSGIIAFADRSKAGQVPLRFDDLEK